MIVEMMPMYIHIIFSFAAATGFAVFLNGPRKTLFISGTVGMTSWIVYVLLRRMGGDIMLSNFVGAYIAAIMSELLARKFKKPTIIFLVPGIITLIPGLGLYNTMYYALEGDFLEALKVGTNVIFASGAIALGSIVAASWYRARAMKERKTIMLNLVKRSQLNKNKKL